jgi:hypothetical protein
MSKPKKNEESQSTGSGFAANDAQTRQRFEEELAVLDEELKPWTDAIQESERLTENDFSIRINARD